MIYCHLSKLNLLLVFFWLLQSRTILHAPAVVAHAPAVVAHAPLVHHAAPVLAGKHRFVKIKLLLLLLLFSIYSNYSTCSPFLKSSSIVAPCTSRG